MSESEKPEFSLEELRALVVESGGGTCASCNGLFAYYVLCDGTHMSAPCINGIKFLNQPSYHKTWTINDIDDNDLTELETWLLENDITRL